MVFSIDVFLIFDFWFWAKFDFWFFWFIFDFSFELLFDLFFVFFDFSFDLFAWFLFCSLSCCWACKTVAATWPWCTWVGVEVACCLAILAPKHFSPFQTLEALGKGEPLVKGKAFKRSPWRRDGNKQERRTQAFSQTYDRERSPLPGVLQAYWAGAKPKSLWAPVKWVHTRPQRHALLPGTGEWVAGAIASGWAASSATQGCIAQAPLKQATSKQYWPCRASVGTPESRQGECAPSPHQKTCKKWPHSKVCWKPDWAGI